MILGLIILTLYLLRKLKTDHQYQELDKKSENNNDSCNEHSLNPI